MLSSVPYGSGFGAPAFGGVPSYGPSFGIPSMPARPAYPAYPAFTPPAPAPAPEKVKVDVVLESGFQKIDLVGNQLCAFAAELEELKVEVTNCNNQLDRELRTQLQQSNDEIYRLRNQLSEYTDRKK